MTLPQPRPRSGATFADDEPIVQSHPLLTDAAVPQFGSTDEWNLNGVIRRPAKLPACAWTLKFSGELAEPSWNLLAREVSMILFNPRHPTVVAAGLSLKPTPAKPSTVISELSQLRRIARWAQANRMPPQLADWHDNDLRILIRDLREQLSAHSVKHYVGTLKMLHQFGPALTSAGLRSDPWSGMSARQAVHTADGELSTRAIPPEQWFPLIRAAWTYIHTFAPDILRARAHYDDLLARATTPLPDHDDRLDRWLADPANPIPVHTGVDGDSTVNWHLLTLLLGGKGSSTATVFGRNPACLRRKSRVERAVADGHPTTSGVITDLAGIQRPDGSTAPWHAGLTPRTIELELRMLRNACYVLVVGLSMMRDSEAHEIVRDSIVEYYGTPAITSTKSKLDTNLPIKHWWITAPVAEAITVAEQLSDRHDKLFPPLIRKNADVARSPQMIDAFIGHVNTTSTWTGLQPIPPGKIRSHMFRKTMAMLTDQFPGSEIALGIQLKHIAARALSNRSTQGYAAADSTWAKHLDTAIEAASFRRIEDLYRRHQAGEPVGYGPGAEQINKAFNDIQQTLQARGGDAAVERALLRNTRLSIRFGVLNHCVMDENNPTGAACLENAVAPPGHKGPLQDRCRPDRCANSVIGPEHIPIWSSQRRTLLNLIDTPGLAGCRKAALQRELTDVETVLDKARTHTEHT